MDWRPVRILRWKMIPISNRFVGTRDSTNSSLTPKIAPRQRKRRTRAQDVYWPKLSRVLEPARSIALI
jgi:hypothetical protein